MFDHDNGDSRRFEVHVDTLEDSAYTLDALADLIQRQLIDPMQQSLSIGTGPAGSSGTSEATYIFGSFEAAQAVAGKYQAHYTAAQSSAETMLRSLRDAADGTRQMARKYRDADDASKAGVQDIERMLTAGISAKAPAIAPDPNMYGGSQSYQTVSEAPTAGDVQAAPTPAPTPIPHPSPGPSGAEPAQGGGY